MKEVERINMVIVYSTQRVELTQHSLYTMNVNKERNCYSYEGFGHLTQNCKRQIIGQKRKIEYKNNLNEKRDLIVLD